MTRIVVVGLGPIGLAAARIAQSAPDLELAGLVDLDPKKIGQTLDSVDAKNANELAAPTIVDSLDKVGPADVAILCTTSYFDKIVPLLRACMKKKLHVTSSCEEMAWPRYRHADLAQLIQGEAHEAGVALVGTGVNQGYVMDLLAVQVSSLVAQVTSV